ncbi:MAG: zinc metalloprotease HtpX [Phormidesmis sp.]
MTTATDLEQLLMAGIAAYKQGDYPQAIASLTQLSQTADRNYRIKASMGLVRTYMAQADWPKAQSICQKIGKSPQPSVQQWANATNLKIEKHKAKRSGFQPLDVQPGSMFHYAYLNGEAIETSSESQTPPASEILSEPETPPAVETAITLATSTGCEWAYADRLGPGKGRSLGKLKKGNLWIAQMGSAVAFYGLCLYLLNGAIALINRPLIFLDRHLPFLVRQIPTDHLRWKLLGLLGVMAIASPWLWDIWLRFTANRQPFSNQQLRTHSPEAATLLGKYCHQRQWPFPTLWKLPTEVPLIFSYGWLPRHARLVMSEGLLAQLEADELATLVAYELSHWQSGYWIFLSFQGLILQIFHRLYWSLAMWGNQQPKKFSLAAGVIANISYCIFWLLKLPGLWISRVRTYYGDRTATETTGNPNGLARTLTKLSFGLAASIEQQGYTPALIESLALLLPISPDLSRQPLYGHIPLSQLFAWDSLNPLRHWMSLNEDHPPLGDRLRLLMAYAQYWKLNLEIPLEVSKRRSKGLSKQAWGRLISQGTPCFGLAFGLVTGTALAVIGAIAHWQAWPALDWMHKDSGLFFGCLWMGTGIGIMLRINRFFPDLAFQSAPSAGLDDWLIDPYLLPVDSLSINLSGTLLGRPGLANWLGQDLLLRWSTSDVEPSKARLLKLHFFSAIGPFGNALALGDKPVSILGRPVQALGWFRRGAQPWLDVDKFRLSDAKRNASLLTAAHPIYSVGWAIAATGTGLWLMGLGRMVQEILNKMTG